MPKDTELNERQFSLLALFRVMAYVAGVFGLVRLFPAWVSAPPLDAFILMLLGRCFVIAAGSALFGTVMGDLLGRRAYWIIACTMGALLITFGWAAYMFYREVSVT